MDTMTKVDGYDDQRGSCCCCERQQRRRVLNDVAAANRGDTSFYSGVDQYFPVK